MSVERLINLMPTIMIDLSSQQAMSVSSKHIVYNERVGMCSHKPLHGTLAIPHGDPGRYPIRPYRQRQSFRTSISRRYSELRNSLLVFARWATTFGVVQVLTDDRHIHRDSCCYVVEYM